MIIVKVPVKLLQAVRGYNRGNRPPALISINFRLASLCSHLCAGLSIAFALNP
jgi:hypothetical protein